MVGVFRAQVTIKNKVKDTLIYVVKGQFDLLLSYRQAAI